MDTGVDTDAGRPSSPEIVELRLPADPAYVAVARLTAAGLAARVDLTVDDVEDLRLAVDEACSLLLPHHTGTGPLELRFEVEPGRVAVQVTVDADPDARVDVSGFTWTVLSALAQTVAVYQDGGRLRIELARVRHEAHL